jgi:hypothetical protein
MLSGANSRSVVSLQVDQLQVVTFRVSADESLLIGNRRGTVVGIIEALAAVTDRAPSYENFPGTMWTIALALPTMPMIVAGLSLFRRRPTAVRITWPGFSRAMQ